MIGRKTKSPTSYDIGLFKKFLATTYSPIQSPI